MDVLLTRRRSNERALATLFVLISLRAKKVLGEGISWIGIGQELVRRIASP